MFPLCKESGTLKGGSMKKYIITLLAVYALILAQNISANPDGHTRQTERWVYRYDGSGSGADYGRALVCGADGNIYVSGYSTGSGTYYDITVISLSDAGDTNWTYRYDGSLSQYDYAYSIAYGLDDNLYVAGDIWQNTKGYYDFAILSVDTLGNERWVYTYGDGNDPDYGRDIVYGADNKVYAAGYTWGGSDQDFAIISRASDNGGGWIYEYDNGYYDYAYTIAYGADNNIYAAGESYGGAEPGYDALVASRTNANGNRWVYRYDGPAGSDDKYNAIIYGGDGHIYAAGRCDGNDGVAIANDFLVTKLDAAGNFKWNYIYNGPGNHKDVANAIVYGDDGNLYVAGYSNGTGALIGGLDFFVVSLDTSGAERWTYRFDGPGGGNDEAWALVFGADTTIYVAGYSTNDSGNADFTVISFTTEGDTNWTYAYDGPGNSGDYARAIDYGADGYLYVGGYSMGSGTNNDITVISIDPTAVADVEPPIPPYITRVEKSGTDVQLIWNTVTTDTLGNPETMDYYVIYRNSVPDFIPGVSDSIGAVSHPDTEYADGGGLTATDSYYYLVKAVDEAGNMSRKSNMGYSFHKFLNENAGATTDRNWVSMPFASEYDSIKDLTDDVSPAGNPISKITRLDPETQNYYSWIYHPALGWYGNDPGYPGNNYPIVLGQAYEMIAIIDDTVIFVGSNEPDSSVVLNENPGGTSDRNWISIPYNAAYDSVKDITDELSPVGDPVSKVTRLDEVTQNYYSWIYHPVLGWYGNDPTHVNFPIEYGDGYEFVAVRDTTWNPIEHSNEAKRASIVQGSRQSLNVEMLIGQLLEPDRKPVWSAAQSCRNDDYLDRGSFVLAERRAREFGEEVGVSHIIHADIELEGFDGLVFTAYRPHLPYDVLTEKSASCVIARCGSYYVISFDVGNFRHAWRDGEEVILIIEAAKKERGYCAVMDFTLDDGVDIQQLVDDIQLVLIPAPRSAKGVVRWDDLDNENVVGYSIYDGEMRLNQEVIVGQIYATSAEVAIRPVIRGGYETVYASYASQSTPDRETPLYFAFNLFPNPFVTETRMEYAVPHETDVDLVVYDVSGRLIKTLVSHEQKPGCYTILWNGEDNNGRKVSSGVYFIRFATGEWMVQDKVLLVK